VTDRIGPSAVSYRTCKSILTKASGFINAYDYTLNPYSGCTFGCTYCYAAFFARDADKQANWGLWIEVKENALEVLQRKRKRPLIDKTIYMSSVTDPYQPIEKRLELTRAILRELLDYHDVRLVIQTRGTLVRRDIDLLQQFERLRVNMTVTTDDEDVRKVFEPMCPSATQRLAAIRDLTAAGIDTCITMTPLLPLRDPETFTATLLETGVERFVVQEFHAGNTRFTAGTGDAARAMAEQLNWDDDAYAATIALLKAHLPDVREGKDGFVPEWL
jgi:DNA repair photolyase